MLRRIDERKWWQRGKTLRSVICALCDCFFYPTLFSALILFREIRQKKKDILIEDFLFFSTGKLSG